MQDFMFKINGIIIASPTAVSWSLSDLSSDESGRSTRTGIMNKDVITQKRTLSFQWTNLTWTQAAEIANLCKNQGVSVYLTYPDVLKGKSLTKKFYTGDIKGNYGLWSKDKIIAGLSCDFIEM